jgi:hypothetical protein
MKKSEISSSTSQRMSYMADDAFRMPGDTTITNPVEHHARHDRVKKSWMKFHHALNIIPCFIIPDPGI